MGFFWIYYLTYVFSHKYLILKKPEKKILVPFEPITSVPFTLLNYSFGFLLLLPLPMLLAGVFAFVYEDNVIAAISVFLLFFIVIILITLHAINAWKKIYTTISINEKGIHFLNKFNGKVVKEISWHSFAKRKKLQTDFETVLYDITTEFPFKGVYAYFIFYRLVDKETLMQKEIFHGNHLFYTLYSNRLKLIQAFLLGITHFRPDLKIDPKTFTDHFIDPGTFEINYKKRTKFFILSSAIILLFSIVVWFLIHFPK